jgi:uroporphyrinogen-III synthase
MRRALVLRPEPGASETMERARKLGLEALSIPLFEVEPVNWVAPDPGGFDGLLLTSANAIRHGGEQLAQLRGLKVHAVGQATADAAREAGFEVAAIGDRGVDGLLGSLDPGLRLLHLCGEDRVDAGEAITAIAVYRARPLEQPDISQAEGSVALIHSPRAGRRFAELVEDRSSIAIGAISAAAAEAVGAGWEIIAVADSPGDKALLALAARLCNKPLPE